MVACKFEANSILTEWSKMIGNGGKWSDGTGNANVRTYLDINESTEVQATFLKVLKYSVL